MGYVRFLAGLLSVLLCASACAQDETGWKDSPVKRSSPGYELSHRFEIVLGLSSRTDETATIDKDYIISGGGLFRLNEALSIQSSIGFERSTVNRYLYKGNGSVTIADLVMRLQPDVRPLSPFAFVGVGVRYMNYEDPRGSISRNEAGVVIGAGWSLSFSQTFFIDLSLRHEIDKAFEEHVVYSPATPPIDPDDPFPYYYTFTMPDAMYNRTSLQIQFRTALK